MAETVQLWAEKQDPLKRWVEVSVLLNQHEMATARGICFPTIGYGQVVNQYGSESYPSRQTALHPRSPRGAPGVKAVLVGPVSYQLGYHRQRSLLLDILLWW